jgi:hypothetical protein
MFTAAIKKHRTPPPTSTTDHQYIRNDIPEYNTSQSAADIRSFTFLF